jgi:putative DNA primase/helicase
MAEPKSNGLNGHETSAVEAERARRSPSDVTMEGEQNQQNSIRPSRRAKRADPKPAQPDAEPGKRQAEGKKPRDRAREIPEDVRKRFTQVGNQFFFPDGTRAFTDRGSRIISRSENTEVIKSLITIAQARGWTDLTLTGTERFRREAWFVARQAGLEVRGYRPSSYEEGRLVRSLARVSEPRPQEGKPERPARDSNRRDPEREESRGLAAGGARREPKERNNGLHIGRLADHGAAPYRHDPKNAMSYFVRLETADGDREIWGVDLHRALKESLTRPEIGDEVGLRAVRRDAVTLQESTRNKDGKIVGDRPLTVHRNRWIVEQREFFAERAQAARVVRDPKLEPKKAVREHPELAGTFLKIRASELAAKAIRDPEDRRHFVDTVRKALADDVARGEPLTPVRLKERTDRQVDPRVLQPDQAPVR